MKEGPVLKLCPHPMVTMEQWDVPFKLVGGAAEGSSRGKEPTGAAFSDLSHFSRASSSSERELQETAEARAGATAPAVRGNARLHILGGAILLPFRGLRDLERRDSESCP